MTREEDLIHEYQTQRKTMVIINKNATIELDQQEIELLTMIISQWCNQAIKWLKQDENHGQYLMGEHSSKIQKAYEMCTKLQDSL